jgi:hypothetical protein
MGRRVCFLPAPLPSWPRSLAAHLKPIALPLPNQLKSKMRFKGHQNTSKNFIRSGFGQRSLIVSGSEVCSWDGFPFIYPPLNLKITTKKWCGNK